MQTFIITVSKYLFIALIVAYTWESFSVLRCKSTAKADGIFWRQNAVIFMTYILGAVMTYIFQEDTEPINIIILAGVQLSYLIIALGVFPIIYPTINKAILSNMCMLLTVGFIVLGRLVFQDSIKQFIIVAIVTMASLIVPFLMSRYDGWKKFVWAYCIIGLILLIAVKLLGTSSGGATISIEIFGFSFQPTEFVKIIFVFFIAGMLDKSSDFKQLVLTAVASGVYVITLVASNDLGGALIFFMIFVFMIYAGTRKIRYLFIGFLSLGVISFLAYNLFSHVQTRVAAWLDPWSIIETGGYQISQSLFAIGSGGLVGTGLYQGEPSDIPVVQQDFVFSAIAEEFGAIFSIMLILICLSCFISFLMIGMEQVSTFNRLVCIGLGVQYATQVILTIGGALKMIPSTGVTLPLISYGGSSILSTLIVFAIIQGLAIVGTNVQGSIRRKKPMEVTRSVTAKQIPKRRKIQ